MPCFLSDTHTIYTDKLVLRDRATGALDVAAIMGDHHILKDDANGQSHFVSTRLQAPQRLDEIGADQAAVEATNSGMVTWKDAHEAWLARTHRELSPGAFGRHILSLGGGKNPKSPFQHSDTVVRMLANTATRAPIMNTSVGQPAPQQLSMTSSAQSTATSVQSTIGAQQAQGQGVAHPPQATPQAQHSIPRPSLAVTQQHLPAPQKPTSSLATETIAQEDSLEKQRQDINRLDNGINYVISTLKAIAQQVERFRQEIRGRPGSVTDDSAIDILTENLSTVMTKTAEIDSLKMQLSVLQRRMKRLEDGSGSTASLTEANTKDEAIITQSSTLDLTGTKWPIPLTANATTRQSANTNKRPPSESSQPETKRQKQGEAGFHAQDPSTQTPGVAIGASPYLTPHQTTPDLWQSAIQPLNVFEQPPPKRGPGRPRKHPTGHQMMPTQTPDSTAWAQTPMGEAPYDAEYFSTQDPGSLDRGLVVRRGGGAYSGPYMSPGNRRERSKPIRNEQGVLIRKDGKPDRRSQTSAENLRRVMSRRQELEVQIAGSQSRRSSAQLDGTNDQGRSQYDGYSPSALLDANGENGLDMDEEDMDGDGERSASVDSISPVNMQGSGPSSALAAFKNQEIQSSNSNQPPPQQFVQNAKSTSLAPTAATHPEIMRKMFPHGMTEEQQRMDFSGQLFRTSTPSETVREKPVARMTQRADMDVGSIAAPIAQVQTFVVPELNGDANVDDRTMDDVPDAEDVIVVDDDDGEQVGDIPP